MAASMTISKVPLNHRRVGVERSPTHDIQCAADGSEGYHCGGDGEDSGGEDDFQEEDGGAGPGEGAEIYGGGGAEDFFSFFF